MDAAVWTIDGLASVPWVKYHGEMSGRVEKTEHPGVYRVHQRNCTDRHGGCACPPKYQAAVSIIRDGQRRLERKHYDTLAAAQSWKDTHKDSYRAIAGLVRDTVEQQRTTVFDVGNCRSALAQLGGRAPGGITIAERCEWFIDGIRSGAVRTRAGLAYPTTTCDDYERRLRKFFILRLGPVPVAAVTQEMMQAFVDWVASTEISWENRVRGGGLPSPKTVQNIMSPIRVIFRQAIHAGEIRSDPTSGLWMPQ